MIPGPARLGLSAGQRSIENVAQSYDATVHTVPCDVKAADNRYCVFSQSDSDECIHEPNLKGRR
jgi:hypothetical protein